MSRILTDGQIAELLSEKKPITSSQVLALQHGLRRTNRNELESRLTIQSDTGRSYTIIATRRDPVRRPRGFSIKLNYVYFGKPINLIRCNGWHAPHQNFLENETLPKNIFHVHYATERYQLSGVECCAEQYAKATDHFTSFEGAIEYTASPSFGFVLTDDDYGTRLPLFEDL